MKLNLVLIFFLFLPDFIIGQENSSQKSNGDVFFKPSVMALDNRLAYLYNRNRLTDDVFPILEKEKKAASIFFLLRDSNSVFAPALLAKYEVLFSKAAKNIFSGQYLKAIIYVESYGRTKICSGANCCGIAQFSAAAGAKYGLVKYTTKEILDQNGKKKKIKIKLYDHRTNPEKSLEAAILYLTDSEKIFGTQGGFAVVSYHMGAPSLRAVLRLYAKQFCDSNLVVTYENAKEVIAQYNISWPKIYFSARPGSPLYEKLMSFKDFSASYYFKVMAAHDLLSLEPKDYEQVLESTKSKTDLKEFFSNRFSTWYPKIEITDKINYLFDKVWQGQFVKIPDSASLGLLNVRIPDTDDLFYYTSPEVVGAAFLISSLFRKSFKKYFEELLITSLARPPDSSELGLHLIGRAFNLSFPKSDLAKERLAFILSRLADLSWLSYKKEELGYLIVVSPNRQIRDLFEQIYEEALLYK